MSAQNSQGIQTLLEAEKDALKIVARARLYRQTRLKEAKQEAMREIETLKATKEGEFKKILNQAEATTEIDAINADTEAKLVQLKETVAANNASVINRLLEQIVKVDAKIHPNASLQLRQAV